MKQNRTSLRAFLMLCFILTFSLSACGFAPLYGTGRGAASRSMQASLAHVDIAIIPDASGQMLRNDLIDRFYVAGYPTDIRYHLKVEPITEVRNDLDITKSSETTRAQLRLTTRMNLTDDKGQAVLSRDLFSIASFNVLQSEFATRVTEDNARENALHDLARQIELNVGLYLQRP